MNLRLLLTVPIVSLPLALPPDAALGQGRRLEGPLEIVPLRANLSMLVMAPAGNVAECPEPLVGPVANAAPAQESCGIPAKNAFELPLV